MVALLENTDNFSKTAHRARGATSRTLAPVDLRSNSLNRIEFRAYTYGDRRRLGSCSNDPIGHARTTGNLYAAYFATKAAMDPGGNDWVFPWDPNAQWWWPFSATDPNPYAPPTTQPPPGSWRDLLTNPTFAILAPCLVGALGGAGIDGLVDYLENGTIPTSDLGRTICSAVSGCFIGTCTAVITIGVLGTTATCGAYLVVGGGSFVVCTLLSDKVCEMCDSMTGGASPPFFCHLLD